MSGGHFEYNDGRACNDLDDIADKLHDDGLLLASTALHEVVHVIRAFLHDYDWHMSSDTELTCTLDEFDRQFAAALRRAGGTP